MDDVLYRVKHKPYSPPLIKIFILNKINFLLKVLETQKIFKVSNQNTIYNCNNLFKSKIK